LLDRWAKEVLSQEWLTVQQVAARLNVSEDTVYRRIRERRLTVRREGRAVRVEADSLHAYVRATTTPALSSLQAVATSARRRESAPDPRAPWVGSLWNAKPRQQQRKRRAAQ